VARPATTPDVDALAERLTPIVLAAVLAKLAGALGASLETPYTTRKGGPVPAEYERRAKRWRADAPTVPGAWGVGGASIARATPRGSDRRRRRRPPRPPRANPRGRPP